MQRRDFIKLTGVGAGGVGVLRGAEPRLQLSGFDARARAVRGRNIRRIRVDVGQPDGRALPCGAAV